ncbi:MAG: hypothetical protein HQL01_08750 [Nitrospirae bacterium]|nr:hypothetical protein [Nitrospirota bacterium]
MRKLAVSVMAMVFALSFALCAYAADAPSEKAVVAKGDTKITIGGTIEFRGEYTRNRYNQINDDAKLASRTIDNPFGFTTPATYDRILDADDHEAYYEGQLNLNLDVQVSDSVQGYIELQSGDGRNADTWLWGNTVDATYSPTGEIISGTGATGIYNSGNSKAGIISIRQAWIKYEKPLYGIKVGHQLLTIGNGLFLDHSQFGDDAIVVFVNPAKDFRVSAVTAKFREGTGQTGVTAQVNTYNVNARIVSPYNSANGTAQANDADAYALLATYSGNDFNVSGDITVFNDQAVYANAPVTDGPTFTDSMQLWNFGLRGDGKIGPVTLRGDLELQAGKYNNHQPGQSGGRFRGWAALVGLDYYIGPVKLTGEFAYGSGKAGDDTGTDITQFVTTLGNDLHYTYVYEYRTRAASGVVSSGLSNTVYVKGGANVEITKTISAETYLYWLNAAKPVALNDTGGFINGVPYVPNYSRELGWELDAKVTYKFAKNLKYWVEGGYFWTGSAYNYRTEETTFTDPTGQSSFNKYAYSRNNAYAVRHGISLQF